MVFFTDEHYNEFILIYYVKMYIISERGFVYE